MENKNGQAKGNEKEVKIDGFGVTLKEIRNLVKGSKITERENKTGSSFFDGSKRFCKVVKTGTEAVYLELNIKLPAKYKDIQGLQTFSPQEASKKHLGTLVHILRSSDEKLIKEIIQAGFETFKNDVAKLAEQVKETASNETASNKGNSKASGKNNKDNKKAPAEDVKTTKLSEEDLKKMQQWEKEGKLKNRPKVEKEEVKAEGKEEVKSEAKEDKTTKKELVKA